MHTGHGRTLLLYEHTRRPPKAEVQAYPIYVSCAQEQMRTVLKTAEKQIRIFIHAQARYILSSPANKTSECKQANTNMQYSCSKNSSFA